MPVNTKVPQSQVASTAFINPGLAEQLASGGKAVASVFASLGDAALKEYDKFKQAEEENRKLKIKLEWDQASVRQKEFEINTNDPYAIQDNWARELENIKNSKVYQDMESGDVVIPKRVRDEVEEMTLINETAHTGQVLLRAMGAMKTESLALFEQDLSQTIDNEQWDLARAKVENSNLLPLSQKKALTKSIDAKKTDAYYYSQGTTGEEFRGDPTEENLTSYARGAGERNRGQTFNYKENSHSLVELTINEDGLSPVDLAARLEAYKDQFETQFKNGDINDDQYNRLMGSINVQKKAMMGDKNSLDNRLINPVIERYSNKLKSLDINDTESINELKNQIMNVIPSLGTKADREKIWKSVENAAENNLGGDKNSQNRFDTAMSELLGKNYETTSKSLEKDTDELADLRTELSDLNEEHNTQDEFGTVVLKTNLSDEQKKAYYKKEEDLKNKIAQARANIKLERAELKSTQSKKLIEDIIALDPTAKELYYEGLNTGDLSRFTEYSIANYDKTKKGSNAAQDVLGFPSTSTGARQTEEVAHDKIAENKLNTDKSTQSYSIDSRKAIHEGKAFNIGNQIVPNLNQPAEYGVTWFGGAKDKNDNGLTATGRTTSESKAKKTGKIYTEGVAMPVEHIKAICRKNNIPYNKNLYNGAIVVNIVNKATGKITQVPVVDKGPHLTRSQWARKDKPVLDITPAVAGALGIGIKGNTNDAANLEVTYNFVTSDYNNYMPIREVKSIMRNKPKIKLDEAYELYYSQLGLDREELESSVLSPERIEAFTLEFNKK